MKLQKGCAYVTSWCISETKKNRKDKKGLIGKSFYHYIHFLSFVFWTVTHVNDIHFKAPNSLLWQWWG